MNLYKPKTAKVLGFFLPQNFQINSKKYYRLFLLFFCFQFQIVYSQSNISLFGEVRDQQNGSPLANVLIRIQESSYLCYSNNQGIFEIENIRPGNYDILIHIRHR